MIETARTSETSVDNYFTRQYIPKDNSELHTRRRQNLKSHVVINVFGRTCYIHFVASTIISLWAFTFFKKKPVHRRYHILNHSILCSGVLRRSCPQNYSNAYQQPEAMQAGAVSWPEAPFW
jgi:hypothetical protein